MRSQSADLVTFEVADAPGPTFGWSWPRGLRQGPERPREKGRGVDGTPMSRTKPRLFGLCSRPPEDQDQEVPRGASGEEAEGQTVGPEEARRCGRRRIRSSEANWSSTLSS
jgi:hypothetical protein